MVKRCSYGTCNTDSRYRDRLTDNIQFHQFPKPGRNLEKNIKWIRLCGRPTEQLNLDKLKNHGTAKLIYVCSKHFANGHPIPENPDPVPALVYERITPARRPPKARPLSEPPRKRLRLDSSFVNEENSRNENDQNMPNRVPTTVHDGKSDSMSSIYSNQSDSDSLLSMLALAAENESLKQQLAKLKLVAKEDISFTKGQRHC